MSDTPRSMHLKEMAVMAHAGRMIEPGLHGLLFELEENTLASYFTCRRPRGSTPRERRAAFAKQLFYAAIAIGRIPRRFDARKTYKRLNNAQTFNQHDLLDELLIAGWHCDRRNAKVVRGRGHARIAQHLPLWHF